MERRRFRQAHGTLDAFAISSRTLTAAGWVVSLENDPITELRVSVDDSTVASTDNLTLPSPDVQADYPAVRGADKCRFVINTDLPSEVVAPATSGHTVSITPYVGDTPGTPMGRFWPLLLEPPPKEESELVGLGDFIDLSFSTLSFFRLLAGLRRDESILDVGCGIGRVAFGLAHYLDDRGFYKGFDASRRFVDLARARFRSLDRFHFQYADLLNKVYNPKGKVRAEEFTFPYKSETFSFAIVNSVFTHMLAAGVNNYLREIRRVLRADGRCYATFFIVDDEAERLIKENRSTRRLIHRLPDGCLVLDKNKPEAAVGFRAGEAHRLIEAAGLRRIQSHPGQWPGRERFLTYQDGFLFGPA